MGTARHGSDRQPHGSLVKERTESGAKGVNLAPGVPPLTGDRVACFGNGFQDSGVKGEDDTRGGIDQGSDKQGQTTTCRVLVQSLPDDDPRSPKVVAMNVSCKID